MMNLSFLGDFGGKQWGFQSQGRFRRGNVPSQHLDKAVASFQ